MQLSPNFHLDEFTASAMAARHNIGNVPNARQVDALRTLCVNVLQPLRDHYGRPIRITSGYRSPRLCQAIGSSAKSQHAAGEAADFEITGVDNLAVAKFIAGRLPFDQLILENYVSGLPNSGWIHCSYREGRLRRETLTFANRTYRPGLPA